MNGTFDAFTSSAMPIDPLQPDPMPPLPEPSPDPAPQHRPATPGTPDLPDENLPVLRSMR